MWRTPRPLRRAIASRHLSSARVAALRRQLADDTPLPSHFAETSSVPAAAPKLVDWRELLPRIEPPAVLDDRFERRHSYLRISLTERCSLRCVYCMPEDGVELTPDAKLMTADETVELASMFVRAGVSKIRLTGGEPTVRRDLPQIIASLDALRPLGLQDISMTTNGIALKRMLPALKEAGLDRLNISLDTLDRDAFARLTRRDALPKVLGAIDRALELGVRPLKVNCVLMRDAPGLPGNEHELLEFARLSLDRPIDVRFIEYMPFDGNAWSLKRLVPYREALGAMLLAYPAAEPVHTDKHDVATSWRLPGAAGQVSFVSSMTSPFCGGCNRLRLTADGNIKTCLFGSAAWSKWPSWRCHGWPPRAHHAAPEGSRLPSALVRSDPAPQIPPRGRVPRATPRQTHLTISLRLTLQATTSSRCATRCARAPPRRSCSRSCGRRCRASTPATPVRRAGRLPPRPRPPPRPLPFYQTSSPPAPHPPNLSTSSPPAPPAHTPRPH